MPQKPNIIGKEEGREEGMDFWTFFNKLVNDLNKLLQESKTL